eukprot:7801129-Alexandrium_andersonii.AAC.1
MLRAAQHAQGILLPGTGRGRKALPQDAAKPGLRDGGMAGEAQPPGPQAAVQDLQEAEDEGG